MASKREQVVLAVVALVKGALPNAKVARDVKKPQSIDPGGNVLIYEGDPGEPEVLLSPLSYTYDHHVPISLAAYGSATVDPSTALDDMLQTLAAAVELDRTLGGLCEFAEWRAPDPQDAEVTGAEAFRWAEPTLVCTYTTTNPLG